MVVLTKIIQSIFRLIFLLSFHSNFFSVIHTGNGWKAAPKFTPPCPIVSDRYGDLGARFADLNGDGRIDIIYHREIRDLPIQKGTYISNGQEWVLSPAFTLPINISPNCTGDLGVEFVDLNADGKDDLVYHKKISSEVFHFCMIITTFLGINCYFSYSRFPAVNFKKCRKAKQNTLYQLKL